jgi:hypothetical protein
MPGYHSSQRTCELARRRSSYRQEALSALAAPSPGA